MIDWSQVHVLIVEDSPTQALLLANTLRAKKMDVVLAKNGNEALSHLETTLPTFIISDITMPEISGFELCTRIRDNPKTAKIPVILFTALYDPIEVIHAIESGANCFLTKPSNPEQIYRYIEDTLSSANRPEEISTFNFIYAGEDHVISADMNKVATLLLSTYNNAMSKARALELAQRELREKNIELKLTNEQKDRFLGMAAHDLRNPLAVIFSFCDLLLEDLEESGHTELIKITQSMRHSAESMLQLVTELLDVSIIESGKLKLKLSRVNLKELIEKNLNINKSHADRKKIKIVVEAPDDLPSITCDEKKIDQVVTNFFTNAIKYSFPDTTVIIRLSSDTTYASIAFIDQGQGIPQDEQSKLFKSFSKTTVKTTGGESSTGLGLVIVKKIIDTHHGELEVSSEVGKGSIFTVKLPLNQDLQAE